MSAAGDERTGSSSAESASASRRGASLAVALWLFCFSFYALTGPGHSSSGDGFLIFLTARNLLNRGHLAIPHVHGTDQLRRAGVDGKLYAKFGPGLMVAHWPMLAVSRVAKHFAILRDPLTGEQPPSLREDEFWVQLTNAWVMASVVTLVFLLCGVFGADARSSLTVSLLVAVASPIWLYARVDATEGLQALGIVGATYVLALTRRAPNGASRDLAGGAFYALSLATKLFNATLLPAFLLFYALTWRKRRSWRALAAFLLPAALSAVVLCGYNFVRFGSPFDTGYDLSDERFDHALLPGALSIVFSPCYGLVLFWPAVFLAVAGVREQFRRLPEETTLIVAVFFILLGAYATWWAYQGFYWGPRYVVPVIPLLATLILPVVRSTARWARAAFLGLFLLGFSVQAVAATTSHWQQIVHGIYLSIECKTIEDCVDNPHIAPLRVAVWYLRALYWREHSPERMQLLLREPPWREAVPWRDPDQAVAKVSETVGVDFWAAPDRWRLRRYNLWIPDGAAGVPSSRLLAAVFALLTAAASVPLARALLSRGKTP